MITFNAVVNGRVLHKDYVAVRVRNSLRGESRTAHAQMFTVREMSEVAIRLLFDGDSFQKGKMVRGVSLSSFHHVSAPTLRSRLLF